jgi:orotidine-5'-phosphate decarboxylase
MMEAARQAIDEHADGPLLIAVTVLTSMGKEDLEEIGISKTPEEQVMHLAKLAQASGLDGVVCSAQETPMLSTQLGKEFCLVTPGIRPAGSDIADQKRVMTPSDALSAGSHYLVIGRPITQSENPFQTLGEINLQIS